MCDARAARKGRPYGADQGCLFDRPLEIGEGSRGSGGGFGAGTTAADNEYDGQHDAPTPEGHHHRQTIGDEPIVPQDQAAAPRDAGFRKELPRSAEIPHLKAMRFKQDLERIANDVVFVDQENLLVSGLRHVISPRRRNVRRPGYIGASQAPQYPE